MKNGKITRETGKRTRVTGLGYRPSIHKNEDELKERFSRAGCRLRAKAKAAMKTTK